MSGIEIAGLVLAVFPVVVKGLQQFSDGVEIVKHWRYYRHELDNYRHNLDAQNVTYRYTIELLLEGIVQLNDELDASIANPGETLHRHEEKLRFRLGESYPVYWSIVQNMREALETVQRDLGIDERGKVCLLVPKLTHTS